MQHFFAFVSVLITWTLEDLIESAASMKCRGYSLKGRTAFSIYRFDNRDRGFVVGMCALMSVLVMAMLLDQTMIRFAPQVVMMPITPLSGLFYAAWAILCLLPPGLEIIDRCRFRRLQQTIG